MYEFSGQVELRSQSVSGGNTSAHARSQAILHGVRLCGLTGNIWPASDDGLGQLVSNEIISELLAFSIQVRRYMELSGNINLKADGPLVRINHAEYRYENDIWKAVNRVVHASEIKVHSATPVPKKHDNLGDLVVAAVMITSPQRDTVALCPQGIFYGFAQSPMTGSAIY